MLPNLDTIEECSLNRSTLNFLLFNDDGVTMSFFGVYLDRNLNLIHPESNKPLLDPSTIDLQFSK